MSKNIKFKYMHTINEIPARYVPGEQICFVNHHGNFIGKLVDSLAQIRKEQRASVKWRKDKCWGLENFKYDYIRVEV